MAFESCYIKSVFVNYLFVLLNYSMSSKISGLEVFLIIICKTIRKGVRQDLNCRIEVKKDYNFRSDC